MNRNIFSFLTLLLISFNAFSQKDTTEIVIVHLNDMHSKIDNFPKLAYKIDSLRSVHKNLFLFSAGDNFTGNPVVDKYDPKGKPIIDLMNRLKFDLSCIGNHEFDYDQDGLNKMIEYAKFPFISANVITTKNSTLKKLNPYIKLRTKNGITIGVFSVVQVSRSGIPATSPEHVKGLEFPEPISVTKKFKTYKDSSDVFIALTHLGIGKDIKLAKECNFFDVIIGGHSHTLITKRLMVNNTLVTQAGSYGNTLGILTLKVVDKKLVSRKDTIINVGNSKKYDTGILKIVKKYNDNPYLNKVIGYTSKGFNNQNKIGELITQAALDTLKNTDIVIIENGGIRLDSIPKGNITVKTILELMPFENTYITYKINLRQLKKLIKKSYNKRRKNDLQVGGISIEYCLNKKGKLKKLILKDKNGKKLKNKKYTIAINNYMASVYKFRFLKNGNDTKIVDSQNVISYIKKIERVDYKHINKITINKKNEQPAQ